MLHYQHGPFVLQGDRHTAIDGGATVHLSARVDDAVWHQALSAIAVTAAAHAAHAAKSEVHHQLRVAEQHMYAPAAPEEATAALQQAAAARQLDGAPATAAAQPESSAPHQAAVQQHLTAINAQELDAALRLHGQVGNVAMASAAVRHNKQSGISWRCLRAVAAQCARVCSIKSNIGCSCAFMVETGHDLDMSKAHWISINCANFLPQVRMVTQQCGVALLRDKRTKLAASTIQPRHRRRSDSQVKYGGVQVTRPDWHEQASACCIWRAQQGTVRISRLAMHLLL